MKKLMFLAALFVATVANAQSFRVGPAASFEINSPTDMKSKVGFNVGVRGELDFEEASKGLFLDASVLFDAKNYKSDSYYDVTAKTSSVWDYNTYGITVPVNIGYKAAVSKSVSLFAAVGPYINFGIGGKSKVTTTATTVKSRATAKDTGASGKTEQTTETKKTVSDNVYSDKLMNRVNWGLGFKVGAEFCRHYQVNVGYELGMNKIFKNSLDSKHRTFTVGVAYMF